MYNCCCGDSLYKVGFHVGTQVGWSMNSHIGYFESPTHIPGLNAVLMLSLKVWFLYELFSIPFIDVKASSILHYC
jgi:hypothetical protein